MKNVRKPVRGGFTLVELVAVVAIIAVIAMLAVSRLSKTADNAKRIAAENDLKVLAAAFTDPEHGYLRDMRGIPGFSPGNLRLANLLVSTNLYGSADGINAIRIDDMRHPGCARPEVFTRWNPESERGWHGPYARHAAGLFPASTGKRFASDASFASRGFYPELYGLRLPDDFINGREGCSIYGFPGEPAILDPWGNPYVLQIPPPQAFYGLDGSNTNLPDEIRFRYARIVSAGPDGRLDAPCFYHNATNRWATSWNERHRRLSRQAGLIDGDSRVARGDDLVHFLSRNDIDEGENGI